MFPSIVLLGIDMKSGAHERVRRLGSRPWRPPCAHHPQPRGESCPKSRPAAPHQHRPARLRTARRLRGKLSWMLGKLVEGAEFYWGKCWQTAMASAGEDVERHQEECQSSIKRRSVVSTISFGRSKARGKSPGPTPAGGESMFCPGRADRMAQNLAVSQYWCILRSTGTGGPARAALARCRGPS